ncbi:Uma2 family endonuclease [Floridanema evergladense]|uniref:Uma2 family endonuclease n=1 Tax=Floridaenema evergladense BLCC-F167 TaxID=3153639 RepID=A0ABV4WHV9_9CYAN
MADHEKQSCGKIVYVLLIADFLQDNFKAEIKRLGLPWVCFREAGIRTGWRKSRLSDLYIVPVEQVREFLDRSAVTEIPPLLAVEVVSPDSISRNYRFKRSEYAVLLYSDIAPRGRASIFWILYQEAEPPFFVPRLNLGTRIWEVLPPLGLIKEAIAFHLESLQKDGFPTPEPVSICEYVKA